MYINNRFLCKQIFTLIRCLLISLCLAFPAYGRDKITVLADDNYPPYIFRDSDGKLKGIVVDHWELWSRKTGIKAEIIATDWGKALTMMTEGKGDVIDTIFYTEERAKIFDYTEPYARLDVPVFFNKNLSGITDIRSLLGYIVGVKDGDACIDILKKDGVNSIKTYPSYEAIIRDAAEGNIHVFCADKPPALYYLYKYKIQNNFRYSLTIGHGEFHRAVRKGDFETMELVKSGFSKITSGENKAINDKWFGKEVEVDIEGIGKYILVVLASALSIAGIMLLLSLYLQRKVKNKTTELSNAVVKLRESEEKTKALIRANPDILFIFDDDGNFIDYRAENNSLLYVSPSAFLGKNIKDVMPPNIAGLTMEMIKSIRNGRDIQTYEYELDMGDKIINCDARMVPFGDGKYLAIVRDVSEKKKREEENIRSHKLESLGVFAGGIAHDFNNILAAIVGSVSLARLKIDDREKTLKLLDNAEQAGIRARKLTEQLLAFSKGGTPVKKVTSIEKVIVESAEFIMSGSKSALSYDIAPDIKTVEVDRGQMEQVIQNIVLNASQAMPSGGKIEISINNRTLREDNSMTLLPGEYVAVSIKDSGEGIEPKNMKRIFDPYFTTKPDGNGLGLTICHTIVKRHGGGIEVVSDPGNGTTFIIYLPALAEGPEPLEPDTLVTKKADLKNLKILIMDDEPQLRYIMEEVLKDEGAKIIQSSDGNEAIDIFEKFAASDEPINIVIADLTIPGGMGGMEAVRILREEGVSFRAIVISGYSTDPVISDYKSYGFDAYLVKPFSADDLLATVMKVI